MSAIPNLRHLCALRAVLETGGVSAAACAIHLTQPAVTQAIASEEALLALGCGSALDCSMHRKR